MGHNCLELAEIEGPESRIYQIYQFFCGETKIASGVASTVVKIWRRISGEGGGGQRQFILHRQGQQTPLNPARQGHKIFTDQSCETTLCTTSVTKNAY